MRILFVTNSYYPHINGVYYFIERLCINLQKRGHEVAVMAPATSLNETHTQINGVDFYGLPSVPVFFYKSVRIPVGILLKDRMMNIIDSFQPDIIHLQDHFVLSKIVVQLCKLSKIPVIATNHFMTENLTCYVPFQPLKTRAERWMWKGFSKVFNQVKMVTTPTETAADLIVPKLTVPVQVVSNGIDAIKFSPKDGVGTIRAKYEIPDLPMMLYVGRLDPEKHIHEVLEATKMALYKKDFCLVICGNGIAKKKLEQLSETLGIEKDVVFTGFVPDEDLPAIYQSAGCFITASIAELQSIATLEAMASGLPVIAADAGALSELVHDGENGYLFKPGDINRIANAIISFLESPAAEQQKMSEASLQIVAEHGIQKTVSAYERLYKKYSFQPEKVVAMFDPPFKM